MKTLKKPHKNNIEHMINPEYFINMAEVTCTILTVTNINTNLI